MNYILSPIKTYRILKNRGKNGLTYFCLLSPFMELSPFMDTVAWFCRLRISPNTYSLPLRLVVTWWKRIVDMTELFDCPPQNITKPHHLSYRIILSLCLGLVVTSVAPNHASPAWQRCRQILVTSSETGKAIRGFKYKPHGAKHYNIHARGHFSCWGWSERLDDGQSHHKWPAAVWRHFVLLMAIVITRPVVAEF